MPAERGAVLPDDEDFQHDLDALGKILDLREGGPPENRFGSMAPERAGRLYHVLDELLRPAAGMGLVVLSRDFDGDRVRVSVGPGAKCGFCTVGGTKDPVHIRVRPKVDKVDYLRLAVLAGDVPGLKPEVSSHLAAVADDSLLVLLLVAYTNALDALLLKRGGLRRLHEPRTETLLGRRRGQVQIARYLGNVARGQLLEVPCRFETHDLDNRENRALLWAAHLLIDASRHGEPTAREPAGRLAGLLPLFAGVTCVPVRPADVRWSARLPEAFRQYDDTGARTLARWIIERMQLNDAPGQNRSIGFSIDMASLFEKAFAAAVAKHFDRRRSQIEQQRWRFSVLSATTPGTFKPDIFVKSDEHRLSLVADTKWKLVMSGARQAEDEIVVRGIKLVNSDMFQILSYAYLARLRSGTKDPVIGALVYPVTDSTVTEVHEIDWIVGSEAPKDVALYLVPWCVGRTELDEEGRTKFDDGGRICETLERLMS